MLFASCGSACRRVRFWGGGATGVDGSIELNGSKLSLVQNVMSCRPSLATTLDNHSSSLFNLALPFSTRQNCTSVCQVYSPCPKSVQHNIHAGCYLLGDINNPIAAKTSKTKSCSGITPFGGPSPPTEHKCINQTRPSCNRVAHLETKKVYNGRTFQCPKVRKHVTLVCVGDCRSPSVGML